QDQISKDMAKIRKNGWPFNWKPFMVKYKCDNICEIGVQNGKNFLKMISHNPKVAIAVDSWIDDGIKSRNDAGYSQEILDHQYQVFKNITRTKSFVKTYRDYSFNAVKNFDNN